MRLERLLFTLAFAATLPGCGDKDDTAAPPSDDGGDETGAPCEDEVPPELCDGLDNDNDGAVDEDFSDADLDGTADCVETTDECDHIDNDGDGAVDEDGGDADEDGIVDCDDVEDCDCVDNNGDGTVDEGCAYELGITASGDDTATLYVDGATIGGTSGWSVPGSFAVGVSGSQHWVAATVSDVSGVQAGFIAAVYVNGVLTSVTGDGSWFGSTGSPSAAGWATSTAGLSEATVASCTWGGLPAFTGTGAEWVWEGDCADERSFPRAWYVAEINICPESETCDGEDNDGDGEADEGFGDIDEDGVADCVDIEDCDGLDNTGEGLIDEDLPDSDGDGTCDERDKEECDGLDNDGNGEVDELYNDTDGDGIADCIDEEECDGLDNDGDGGIDEGYGDSDEDGTADCVDKEECDGLDNDGDGKVDELWGDVDGDSVVDCLDVEDCDGIDNDGDGAVDEDWADTDGDGVGDCEPEACDCEDNDGDGLVDEDCKYSLSVIGAADDTFDLYLDGAAWGTGSGWGTPDTFTTSVMGGTHHIAAEASDIYGAYAGFAAVVSVDGVDQAATGDGLFMGEAGVPTGTGWSTSTLGLSSEQVVVGPWGLPGDLAGTGAEWVWQGGSMESDSDWVTDSYYVLELDLCGSYEPEVCDGVDNDEDGEIDEGYSDVDEDGVADCVDEETCGDELDNDGDGSVDEDCIGDCPAPTYKSVCTITLSSGAVSCTGANPMTLISTSSGYTYELQMAEFDIATFNTLFSGPKDWALHISDSPTGDGNSGDGGDFENDSEFQVFGTSVALYGSDVVSSALQFSQSSAFATYEATESVLCDSYFSFESSTTFLEARGAGVFQIDGDEADSGSAAVGGLNDRAVYLGVNRVVGSTSRTGSGVKAITVTFGK